MAMDQGAEFPLGKALETKVHQSLAGKGSY